VQTAQGGYHRHGLDHEVSGLLKRGITSTSAGGFFFIPYLLQLGSHGLLGSGGQPSRKASRRSGSAWHRL